tara:strand:+ start:4984 stop:6192 length:1209 start_codon:yes stop_codon:yes gene_type:complete
VVDLQKIGTKSKKLWRVDERELAYIQQAIASGLTGDATKTFEEAFAKKFGVQYAIAVNSGTSALHAAIVALEIGPGDEVIVPPLTFIAPAFAPLFVGAIPVFADIDPQTFNIDPEDIRRKITPRTRAIITVSLYGLSPDMDTIMEIATQHNLKVIEDNAQCVLGRYKKQIVGTIGDISIFSLQRSKHLTAGGGGVAITNNEKIAEKFRKVSDLGYTTLTAKPISNEDFKERIQHPDFKRHELIGYNFRMPDVCAAMALAQVEKMDMLLEKRIAIAKLYEEVLRVCDWLIPQHCPKDIMHTYWTYAIKLDTTKKAISWLEFRTAFRNNGGERFYGAWTLGYLEPALEGMKLGTHGMRYEKGLCPVAESVQPYIIQLKTNFEDLQYAHQQSNALAKTISQFSLA